MTTDECQSQISQVKHTHKYGKCSIVSFNKIKVSENRIIAAIKNGMNMNNLLVAIVVGIFGQTSFSFIFSLSFFRTIELNYISQLCMCVCECSKRIYWQIWKKMENFPFKIQKKHLKSRTRKAHIHTHRRTALYRKIHNKYRTAIIINSFITINKNTHSHRHTRTNTPSRETQDNHSSRVVYVII